LLGQAGDPRIHDARSPDNRIKIEGGTFLMGAQKNAPDEPGYDSDAYDDESPSHRVEIAAFEIGRFPVTVEEFEEFVDAGEVGYLKEELWTIFCPGWSPQLTSPRLRCRRRESHLSDGPSDHRLARVSRVSRRCD